jgi:D-3-phosphoglycerate dehydrogenase
LGDKIQTDEKGLIVKTDSLGSLEALLSLLKNNKIKGAALDVLQNELSPLFLKKNKLIEYSKKNSNLIITPHIAGVTKESFTITENFLSIQAKKIIENFYNEKKI